MWLTRKQRWIAAAFGLEVRQEDAERHEGRFSDIIERQISFHFETTFIVEKTGLQDDPVLRRQFDLRPVQECEDVDGQPVAQGPQVDLFGCEQHLIIKKYGHKLVEDFVVMEGGMPFEAITISIENELIALGWIQSMIEHRCGTIDCHFGGFAGHCTVVGYRLIRCEPKIGAGGGSCLFGRGYLAAHEHREHTGTDKDVAYQLGNSATIANVSVRYEVSDISESFPSLGLEPKVKKQRLVIFAGAGTAKNGQHALA
jgi:hypothetical protein